MVFRSNLLGISPRFSPFRFSPFLYPRVSPRVGARLARRVRALDDDLRTSASFGTPLVELVHDYYPFALKDKVLLAHIFGG